MNDNVTVTESVMDNRKWFQKIITIRPADDYNTKRIMIELPLITVSTMDSPAFRLDAEIDIDGVMIGISVPYLRFWIGKKTWHKYSNLGWRRPAGHWSNK